MKLVALYHPQSDHGSLVESYFADIKRSHNIEGSLLSLESPEGARIAKLFDVVAYPAILVTSDEGSLQQLWQGLPLPLSNEVLGEFRR